MPALVVRCSPGVRSHRQQRAGAIRSPGSATVCVLVPWLWACGRDLPEATLDDLRQPTGVALSDEGRFLFVTNGNWDQAERTGGVLVLDLQSLHDALADHDEHGPCRVRAQTPVATIECGARGLVVPRAGITLGSAVGNLARDRPAGVTGALRLLTVQRAPAAVVWFDVIAGDDGPQLDCGVGFDGNCDDVHVITTAPDRGDLRLPPDPARVVVDDQGYRFAYVPQLFGERGSPKADLSLIDLDGEFGPELVNVAQDVYRDDPFDGTEYSGGFGVASRPCDLANAPDGSRDCTRPVLYGSQRFFPSLRRFAVAPGLDVIVPGEESSIANVNPESVQQQPFLADLAFEDPSDGVDLLVVQTTPAALLRIDTTVEDGRSVDAIVGMLPLCEQPNMLAVHRHGDDEPLALVSCFAEGELAIVGLTSWRVLQQLELEAGANEITIDPARQWAFVANTPADSISVVSLDRDAAGYLTEIARIVHG